MGFDMADVKPSLLNLATVTIMAILGISIMKYAMGKYPIPGLSSLVANV